MEDAGLLSNAMHPSPCDLPVRTTAASDAKHVPLQAQSTSGQRFRDDTAGAEVLASGQAVHCSSSALQHRANGLEHGHVQHASGLHADSTLGPNMV